MTESDTITTLECRSCGHQIEAEDYAGNTCPECGASWEANKHTKISVQGLTIFAVLEGD